MSSKNIKRCTICEQWFHRNNGVFMKHIRTCQQQVSLQSSTDKKCPRSSNPLLSVTTDYQSPEIDYNCDLYGDHSFDQMNLEVNNDNSFTDGDSIISSHYILLSNIILYTIIHKMKRALFAIILHNDPMRGIDFR
jgi:hypothetical protein